MMSQQAYNPFLPLYEYIPDGEPHVFGDRVYLIGSHDEENGDTYCKLPYAFYSAPIDDLSNWQLRQINYSVEQDPFACAERHHMYAPDVVRGNDGRYYLYYCLSGDHGVGGYWGPISVAVSDEPDGRYSYLGFVQNRDGSVFKDYVAFDPAVINDDGVIRLYYGTQFNCPDPMRQTQLFHKSLEEIASFENNVMGAVTVTLDDDMLTVSSSARRIAPLDAAGTSWEAHPFFEGGSIRKIGKLYYFIYSSSLNHELCYATSAYPDRDFECRGTIISNGDIGFQERPPEKRVNTTATNHGSIEKINGQWYIFYHRITHASDYSRQACAEPIFIAPDGTICQVEMTSSGLNQTPLDGCGVYPAVICCNLTNGQMPHVENKKYECDIPCISSESGQQMIRNIKNGTSIGYKYFYGAHISSLRISYRGTASGTLFFSTCLEGAPLADALVKPSDSWTDLFISVPPLADVTALYFKFAGTGYCDFLELELLI